MDTRRTGIKRVTKLAPTEEYVYDISIKNQDPYFFANDCLVHNTDSVYFSAYPILVDAIQSGELEWSKDKIIKFYDGIADEVNSTFPAYMKNSHNCPSKYGRIIAAGRETVGESGIFITKKRYGIMVIDDEGTRLDSNGSRGKIKVMGLEIKRSDTPAYMQNFLNEILRMALEGYSEAQVIDRIKEFRKEFRDMKPWEKGTPKRVNNLTKLTAQWEKTGTCQVGHALAAINYNHLRKLNNDHHSLEIVDGMKTIVCKLKPNPLKITSIGIPSDEKRIPAWYRELPFDEAAMEEAIVTRKIENLLGTLGWDLHRAECKTTLDDLFEF